MVIVGHRQRLALKGKRAVLVTFPMPVPPVVYGLTMCV